MKFKIREMRESDIDTLMSFKKDSLEISFPGKSMDMEMFRDIFMEHVRNNREGVRIAEHNSQIIGYIWLSCERSILGDYGLVHHLYVKKEFRSKGVGKSLMKMAEEYFKAKGIKRIKLTVTLTNEPSLRLSEKLGYKRTRIIMEKMI